MVLPDGGVGPGEVGLLGPELVAENSRTCDQVTYVLRRAAATPAAELIDALRVIDAKNADVAALVQLLSPGGIWGETASVDAGKVQCPSCGRRVPVIDGRLANHLRHPSTPTDNCDGGDPALMGW